MFHENTLLFQSSLGRVLFASAYFVFAGLLFFVDVALISSAPDAATVLPQPLLFFVTVQLFLHVLVCCVLAVPIPYLIGTGRPFVASFFNSVPGGLLTLSFTFSILLTLTRALYCSLESLSPHLSHRFVDRKLSLFMVLVALVISIYTLVSLTRTSRVLHFDMQSMHWERNVEEVRFFRLIAAYGSFLLLLVHSPAVFDELYKVIHTEGEERPGLGHFGVLCLSAVLDALFVVAFLIPDFEPIPASGLLQMLVPATWPTLSLLLTQRALRKVLWIRSTVMMTTLAAGRAETWRGRAVPATKLSPSSSSQPYPAE